MLHVWLCCRQQHRDCRNLYLMANCRCLFIDEYWVQGDGPAVANCRCFIDGPAMAVPAARGALPSDPVEFWIDAATNGEYMPTKKKNPTIPRYVIGDLRLVRKRFFIDLHMIAKCLYWPMQSIGVISGVDVSRCYRESEANVTAHLQSRWAPSRGRRGHYSLAETIVVAIPYHGHRAASAHEMRWGGWGSE